MAKHLGARITTVCNAHNVETVRSLGASEVIDYTRDDFTERRNLGRDLRRGRQAPVLALPELARAPRGVVARTSGLGGQTPILALVTAVTSRFGTRRVRLPIPRYANDHVLSIEAGDYRAVIDRRYPSRTWSKRPGTSRPSRRQATSS